MWYLENMENCNKINKNPQQNNTAYLQVLPFTISYGDKELPVNVLLNSGSHSTLISKFLPGYLNLSGREREIQFSNAFLSITKIKSKLVNFFISSSCHPGKINVKNRLLKISMYCQIKLTRPTLKTNGHTSMT